MKRLLLFSILQFVMFCMYAQTTADTALPLKEGDNSFTFESSQGQNTVYFVYTAPVAEGKLLTVEKTAQSASYILSEDGTYNTAINGITDGNISVFPVKKGQRVYLAVSVYNEKTVQFKSGLASADVEGGASCEHALTATEVKFYVPSYYDRQTYQTNPTFLSYECKEDGLLEITIGSYPATMVIREGCEGESKNLTVTSAGNDYIAKHAVEAGKRYVVETALYSPAMASFRQIHATPGSSCEIPFTGKETENLLPQAAGKYWYEYTPSKAGFMRIISDYDLPGGNISIFTSCSSTTPLASIDGYFAIRCKVEANAAYLICIEMAEETDAAQTFGITVEDPATGDSFENPVIIEAGTYTVPQFDGTYFYKITIPEGKNRFLILDAQSANLQNSNSGVKLYKPDNSYSPVESGKDKIKYEVSGGSSYLIAWNCNEGYNAFGFTVSYQDIAPGDVCSDPITANSGRNNLSAGTVKYYQYQAAGTGWLLIDADITVGVGFPKGCEPYSGEYDAVKAGTVTKTNVTAGTNYLIRFTNMEEPTHFTLSEENYREGETCDLATPLKADTTALPESILNHWYQYIAKQDGMVTISSDIIYEQSADNRKSALVSVKAGSCSAIPVSIIKSNSEGTWFDGKFVVRKDDVLFINVITCSAQTGKKLNTAIRDLLPGEACFLPLALLSGEVIFPEATRNLPVWYDISLQPGDFQVSSANAFTLSLYKECNDAGSLAQSNYYYDPADGKSEYKLDYTVTEKGTYLLKLEMSYANTLVHVSGSAITTGIEKTTGNEYSVRTGNGSITVTPDSQQVFVEIYDFAGKIIHSRSIPGTTSFVVPKGFYIIKAGGHIQKVVVDN